MKENSIFKKLTKGKRLLFIAAPALALVLAGGIVTATVLSGGGSDTVDKNITEPVDDNKKNDADVDKIDPDDSADDGKEASGSVTVFADPLKEMNVLHTFGFYYNSTLNTYYEHDGIDLSAAEGSDVYATTDGKITEVYTGDLLTGGQITLEGDGGIVTVYSFVDPVEGIAAGSQVKKGDVIATVSAASGGEYKDGAHVHMEVLLNGKAVDPENYLSTTQK